MSKTLKHNLITMLKLLDTSNAPEAEKEVGEAIETLKDPSVIIDFSPENQEKVVGFFLTMYERFPGLYTDKNQHLMQQWGVSPEESKRQTPRR